MASQAVLGHQGRWSFANSNAIPSTTVFSGTTPTFSIISDSVGLDTTLGYTRGLRGTRGQKTEGSRFTQEDITGTLVMEVSPKWLDFILPQITGDATSPHTLQESLGNGFDYQRYDGITGASRQFRNCYVDNMRLSFNGDFVEMALDIIAQDEQEVTFAGAALLSTIDYEPYIPAEMVFTAGNPGAARPIETMTFTIANNLTARRRMQLKPQCVLAGIRAVTLDSDAEWGATTESELYNLAKDGFAATIVLTRENMSSTISISKLQIPDRTPGISGPDEILYTINGFCRATGATDEISWTNDSTNV